MNGFAKTVAFG